MVQNFISLSAASAIEDSGWICMSSKTLCSYPYQFFHIFYLKSEWVLIRQKAGWQVQNTIFVHNGSPDLRNGGGKSRFWTPSWLFLTSWTCGFSVFYVKEASCLISSSSATFTLSSFSSSITSLISSSTCPILTFYTFLETSDQMLVNGEEKKVDLMDFIQLFWTSIL